MRLITDAYYTQSDEALALTHKFEYVDIYSNSWGPYDDGKSMDRLHEVLQDAFELTIKEVLKLHLRWLEIFAFTEEWHRV